MLTSQGLTDGIATDMNRNNGEISAFINNFYLHMWTTIEYRRGCPSDTKKRKKKAVNGSK